ALPGSRLRQGARRMELDGTLLQLYPGAQHTRPGRLRCSDDQGAFVGQKLLHRRRGRPSVCHRDAHGADRPDPPPQNSLALSTTEFLLSLDVSDRPQRAGLAPRTRYCIRVMTGSIAERTMTLRLVTGFLARASVKDCASSAFGNYRNELFAIDI